MSSNGRRPEQITPGFVVVNRTNDDIIPESFHELKQMAIGTFCEYQVRIGGGRRPWSWWQQQGYDVRAARIIVEQP